jgi:hypothetical protein
MQDVEQPPAAIDLQHGSGSTIIPTLKKIRFKKWFLFKPRCTNLVI